MRKLTKMKAVREEFLTRVMPEFESWGLSRHPNPSSYFGRADHGFHYDFADTRDASNIKLAGFAIIQPRASLWIRGYKTSKDSDDFGDLIVLFDNIHDIFVLRKNWSLLSPFNVGFELKGGSDDDVEMRAKKLIDDVLKNLHKLKSYLYG